MKISISEQILTQNIDDELVLLHIDTGRYFGLQPIGHRIWQLLSEHKDTDQVYTALLSEYTVDGATLRQDLDELVASLLDARLLTLDSTPT